MTQPARRPSFPNKGVTSKLQLVGQGVSTVYSIPASPERKNDSRNFVERYSPLVVGEYRADFSRDTRLNPPVYHLVISKVHSPTILVFSQDYSLEALKAQAAAEIECFLRTEKAD